MKQSTRKILYAAPVLLLVLLLLLLHWGGYLLLSEDRVPAHADAAVVLQGSYLGESVRIPEGIRLLQQGATSRVLLSIQSGQIWGEDVPPMARRFLQLRFGAAVSDRIDFCETGPEVNSTADEARVLAKCISDHGWHSVVVVTSDYHTRRAGMTWKRVLREKRFALDIVIDGVADPEYSPSGWWRERTYAKTWLLEFTKLCWTTFVPWGS